MESFQAKSINSSWVRTEYAELFTASKTTSRTRAEAYRIDSVLAAFIHRSMLVPNQIVAEESQGSESVSSRGDGLDPCKLADR